MTTEPRQLPHDSGRLFLTDSGLETTLIFLEGMALPHFAAIDLMRRQSGRDVLTAYFERHVAIAAAAGMGFVLEGPTWRAGTDWCDKLGISAREMVTLNRDSVTLMREVRSRHETDRMPIVVSGNIGPRGDGYQPGSVMTPTAARDYHAPQVDTLVEAGADMISAFTMTNTNEAIGIVRAAVAAKAPVVVSFTVETDGRLPTGQPLGGAIEEVDDSTSGAVAYYMINCAHPDHFDGALSTGERWTGRIGGLRANASRRSHRELDEAADLDDGDPAELGLQYGALRRQYPGLVVLGGCCGTDHRHITCIAEACRSAA